MAWYNPFSRSGSSGNSRKQGYQNESPSSYSSDAAARVTFDSAMTVSAFWACTRLLSETVSSMPIRCYKRMPDGSRQEDRNYPLWRTLNYQPNRYQTRTEFFESLMLQLVTDGNFYAETITGFRGVSSFMPLMSSQMEVKLLPSGEIQYEYTDYNSSKRIIPSSKIWHVRLFGNSIVGMSPLGYARQSLGVSIATENRVGKLAKSGGKMSGYISIDKQLSPTQRGMYQESATDMVSGDKVGVFEFGSKFNQIGLSPQDMQLLESRRYGVEDVARFFGVPSVLINDTAGSTTWGSGVEQLIGGFYKLNLKPYLERIESSMRHLMPMEDWDNYDIEFDFDSLLRADRETRLKANSTAINSGQLTPNEARNSEGLEDKDGGDKIYLNGSLNASGEQPVAPAPIVSEEEESDSEDDQT